VKQIVENGARPNLNAFLTPPPKKKKKKKKKKKQDKGGDTANSQGHDPSTASILAELKEMRAENLAITKELRLLESKQQKPTRSHASDADDEGAATESEDNKSAFVSPAMAELLSIEANNKAMKKMIEELDSTDVEVVERPINSPKAKKSKVQRRLEASQNSMDVTLTGPLIEYGHDGRIERRNMALYQPATKAELQRQIQPFGGNQQMMQSSVGPSDPVACFAFPSFPLQFSTQPFPPSQQMIASATNPSGSTMQIGVPSTSFENQSQIQPFPQSQQMISSGPGAFGTQLEMNPFRGLDQSQFSLPVAEASVFAKGNTFALQKLNEASISITSQPGGRFTVDNRIRGSVQQQSDSGYMAQQFDMRVHQTYSEEMDVDEVL
jgi:hypothetical protein